MRAIATKTVRNVVAQGKTDKLAENDRQKSLSNKNELSELKSQIKGELPLPHGINADDGISTP